MADKLSIKRVFNTSVEIFKENMALCLAIGAVAVVGGFGLEAISNMLADNGQDILNSLWGIVTWFVQMYGGLVLIKTMLRLSAGETINLKDWKSLLPITRKEFVRYLIVSFMYGLIILGGTILIIIPGIIWGIKYMFATYITLDRQTRIKESLELSSQLTNGNKWNLFVMMLLFILVNLAGVLLLGIGLIVTMPLTALAGAVAYRQLQNSPTPAPSAFPTYSSTPVKSTVNDYQI